MTQADEEKQRRKNMIAAGLRVQRANKNETQEQVGAGVGVDKSTVSAWENTGCVGAADAWGLADYYGISLDELVKRTVPNTQEAVA